MSNRGKQTQHEDWEATSSTIPDSARKGRRLFKRQPDQPIRLSQSRRNSKKSRDMSPPVKPPSYIKMPLEPREGMWQTLATTQQYTPPSVSLTHLSKRVSINKVDDVSLRKRLRHLEQQLEIRTQELELVEDEKDRVVAKLTRLELEYTRLENQIQAQYFQTQNLRGQMQRAKLQVTKAALDNKALWSKIAFMEQIQFSSETKNVQTLRENHLEGELAEVRLKLSQDKSSVELLLQEQIRVVGLELSVSVKEVQTLGISNSCLRKKLDSVETPSQDDQYRTLRAKYRKMLVEHRQLKRGFEALEKENRLCRLGGGLPEPDLSLELSLFSLIN